MFKRCFALLCCLCLIPAAAGVALSEGIRGEMPVVVDTPLVYLDDRRDELRRAQQCLARLGYLAGVADGVYGPRTRAALLDFQEGSGLPASGRLDDETLSRLEQLASGVVTTDEIQRRLIDLGYLQGTADGVWGPRSEAAMRAFQQLNGLPATGAFDGAADGVLFSDGAVALPAGVPVGSKGDDVVALQQRLIQFGFHGGRADGSYGRQTAGAVTAFQRHLIEQGFSVVADGAANPVTLFYLYGADYSTYLCDVSVGVSGAEARRVETRLVTLGYMDAAADDAFDGYAAEALAAFQGRAGLPVDGVADADTVAALFGVDAPAAERCVLHDISSGDRGLVVSFVEEALLTGGMAAMLPGGRYGSDVEAAVERLHEYLQASPDAALFADRGHLSREAVARLLDGLPGPGSGDIGSEAEARRIQRRLHSLYYLSRYGVDGVFGSNSVSALREFQATNGLPETGKADRDTLSRLFSAGAVAKRLPYRVEVSLADQTVTVYGLNDQDEYEPVRSFICSSGLHNSTPRGIFLDGGPGNRWHYFSKFDCWAQYSFDIEGNILFHSVLYSEKDERTLRKGSVYALGSPASHGCIRLAVKDARWLFEHCRRGSVVIVIY